MPLCSQVPKISKKLISALTTSLLMAETSIKDTILALN